MKRTVILLTVALALGLWIIVSFFEDEPPSGVEQLLPRGRIAAIDEPRFVAAEEADLPDDAWVFGVAIGEEARAYSLNLLNHHEVVNDTLAGRPIAAVW